MSAPHTRPSDLPEPSSEPTQGWHCSHLFYRLDRGILNSLSAAVRQEGVEELAAILNPQADQAPTRLQSFVVSGNKADFAVISLDPDPLRIEHLNQSLLAGKIGAAIVPSYSFVSLTEISEYVPSPEQYAARLESGGEDPQSAAFQAKLAAYEKRLPMMNTQRLTPELPDWPAMCFYPMNKSRVVGANWFTTPFSNRNAMMAEHAQSGMAFAGRVTQVVTVSVGLDDWEWGVTLWARRPDYLKDIVYKMRFDEASAKYAEFGPFYIGYQANGAKIAEVCKLLPG